MTTGTDLALTNRATQQVALPSMAALMEADRSVEPWILTPRGAQIAVGQLAELVSQFSLGMSWAPTAHRVFVVAIVGDEAADRYLELLRGNKATSPAGPAPNAYLGARTTVRVEKAFTALGLDLAAIERGRRFSIACSMIWAFQLELVLLRRGESLIVLEDTGAFPDGVLAEAEKARQTLYFSGQAPRRPVRVGRRRPQARHTHKPAQRAITSSPPAGKPVIFTGWFWLSWLRRRR